MLGFGRDDAGITAMCAHTTATLLLNGAFASPHRVAFDGGHMREARFAGQCVPCSPFQRRRFAQILTLALVAASYALAADAQTHEHNAVAPATSETDARQLAKFPEAMRLHTITSMRDHLLALQEIDEALSKNDFDKASRIAARVRDPRRWLMQLGDDPRERQSRRVSPA